MRYGLLMTTEVYFRAGIGLLVMNLQGLVLAAERSDTPGAWQAPQGGLLPGEEPVEAAPRELAEETGIRWSDVTLVAEHPEWLGYELPPDARSDKTGRGQVQKWFIVRYNGADEAVNLPRSGTAEFRQWTWLPMSNLVARAWHVKQPVYRRLAETWPDFLSSGE